MTILFAVLWGIRKKDLPTGWMTAITFIVLGIQRFLVEFLRQTTPSFIPGISQAQIIAVVFVAAGVVILWKSKKSTAGQATAH
jgi:prolipoprotein diacylglyceryltransferase